MKKPLIMAGLVLGLAALFGAVALAWTTGTITGPYPVRPLTLLPASEGAIVGHSVVSGSRTLSIVSSNDVTVVADPGASFKHVVVWLVERPRKEGTHSLIEFKCALPQFADAGQIRPLGSTIPPKIQQVANGGRW